MANIMDSSANIIGQGVQDKLIMIVDLLKEITIRFAYVVLIIHRTA